MMRSSRGVTLVEGLAVVAILMLLVGIGARSFFRFTDEQTLAGAASTVRAVLDDARARTLASQGGNIYGVRVESGSVTTFPSAYITGNPANSVVVLPSSIETVASLTGGVSEVVFARLTGAASTTGSITVRLRKNPSAAKVITVNGTGLVELTE